MSTNNENTFSYTYSAKENEEVQRIRDRYTQPSRTDMDELKELDAKVHRPANVFACIYGSVSAIIMGAGMSLVMTDIGEILGLTSVMVPGIAIGIVGLGMALTTWPIYKAMRDARKKQYAPQILALSEKIMQDKAV